MQLATEGVELHLTGGGQRLQPVFCIACQASIALCRRPASHRLRRAGRNVAVGPAGDPLRMHGRRVGLEVTELPVLLGIQPPLTTSPLWRLVKAAVLVGQTSIHSQTG